MLAVCICTPLPPSHSEMSPLPPEPHGPTLAVDTMHSSCIREVKCWMLLLVVKHFLFARLSSISAFFFMVHFKITLVS